jgi:hypothetical protein
MPAALLQSDHQLSILMTVRGRRAATMPGRQCNSAQSTSARSKVASGWTVTWSYRRLAS